MSADPLRVVDEIREMLTSGAYSVDEGTLSVISDLENALVAEGYTRQVVVKEETYSESRAQRLLTFGGDIQAVVQKARERKRISPAEKAEIILSCSTAYLKTVHAFKVGSKVWSAAQKELLPELLSVHEGKLDDLLELLDKHLSMFSESLEKWLTPNK
tara:strand:+ start:148845 stop:149318 length:474 start_codon:yes stop_codon:yes gene_type:complete